MLSRILTRSCFSVRTFFHGSFVFLKISATLAIVKSVGIICDKSFHSSGMDTVADSTGLGEKMEAYCFSLGVLIIIKEYFPFSI